MYGPKFFELFAKCFRIFRPRGNYFDGPIFFQNLADSAAIRLVQKSSKSEPSSPFFGRLLFLCKFVPCELLQNFLCGYKIEMAIWFIIKDMDPWIRGSAAGAAARAAAGAAAGAAASAATVCTLSCRYREARSAPPIIT